jgi:peptide deformylase
MNAITLLAMTELNLSLLPEGHSDLLEVSEEWDFRIDGSPEELVRAMSKFMSDNGGVGLAAPQLGIKKRIFIMGNFTKLVACINPKIVSLSEDRGSDLEGCLSFPDLFMKVKRPSSAVVQYNTASGELVERELTGLECRVFLHEYDHLIGVTFDQRVGNLSFKMAKDKRKKELKKLSRKD